MAGALVGARLPNTAARGVTPAPANPARANAVRTLENEGVTALTAGQRTGNERLRWVEDATAMVPGGGGRATAMQTQANEQFTRAVLARAGIQAERVTPDVLNTAFNQIGQEYRNFGGATNVRGSPQVSQAFRNVARQYENITNPSTRVPVVTNLATDLSTAIRNGISGQQYNAFRSDMQRLARELKRDPQASNSIRRMTEYLDLAMLRSAPRGQRTQIAQALQDRNRRYRNLLAIEDASGAAGEAAASGLLTPTALKAAIKKNDKKGYTRNRNDMAPLARAGTEAITPLRSSGTAERTFAQGIVSAPSLASTGLAGIASAGDPMMMLAGALAPPLIKAATARGIMSGPAQRYFGNQRIPHNVEPLPPQVAWPLALSQFDQYQGDPLMDGMMPRYQGLLGQ
jgi:hypothetical protein